MQLLAGTRLGPYEVVGLLGAGGMGEVYRARDPRLGREVAIKVLPSEVARDPDRLRRFEHEARAAGSLNHPHILAVFDVGSHDGTPYIVSELLEGETLRERIRAGLSSGKAVDYAVQIAHGLAAAHGKGIVHRDLKPENVFLTKEGQVKLLDFGLAKLRPALEPPGGAEEPTLSRTTEPGAVLGTAAYMSPEQVRGLPADHRSDIFSLGAVLYEMLARRRAFAGETAADTMSGILRADPPPLSDRGQAIPPPLERIVRRCLEKRPDERFQSAEDVAFALQAVSEAGGPIAPPRRRWLALALAGALLAVAILLIAVRTLRRGPEPAAAPIRSIAVLPLENLSRDPEQDYFADGMTEALIGDLAKIASLRVISRTSVMRYKGARKPLPEIARELKVDAVVEGSVLRSGDRVRITAQLIRGATDEHVWNESYERDLTDVFALQGEVARAITRQIRVAVTPQERTRLSGARPVDPKVHEAYLKGRFYWNKRNEEALKRAIAHFQEAIAADPGFAPAHSGLADSYISLVWPLAALAPAEAMAKAKAATKRALEIDEGLAESHTSLATTRFLYDWDWPGAEKEFQRALELDPSYAHAHHYYSHYLMAMGRVSESVAESRRAIEVDPLSANLNNHLGWNYLYARRYDEAATQLSKTLEMDPHFLMAHIFLGRSHEGAARYPEAVAELQNARDLSPQSMLALSNLAAAYARSGRRADALKLLDELKHLSRRRSVPAYEVAVIHAALDDRDQAFAWLERAYAERSDELVYLNVDPRLDGLRPDPRLADLVRRVGLPKAASPAAR